MEKSAGRERTRQSNIELLRIVAMVGIVAHHFAVHGGFEFPGASVTVNRLWVQLLQMGGQLGINVFVLISGYFSITATGWKPHKAARFWAQLITYSLLLFALFAMAGIEPFSVKTLIKRLLPLTFTQWWFASTYFVMFLLLPFLNQMLRALSRKMYAALLLLLTACWCVIPTLILQIYNYECSTLLWFLYLYALAGYLRLYPPKKALRARTYLGAAAALIGLTFLSTAVFDFLGTRFDFFAQRTTYFYGRQTVPMLAVPVLLLLGFAKLDMGSRPRVNQIAAATFGVYLLHDDNFVRPFLWKTVLGVADYQSSPLLIPYSLLTIAAVYCVSTAVELMRIRLLEKPFGPKLDRAVDTMLSHIHRKLS